VINKQNINIKKITIMANTNVKGAQGILSFHDGTAYKPIICLTSTSMSRVSEVIQKVNYCTQGETISKVDRITRTVNFDGEVMTVGTPADGVSYDDLITAIESMEEQNFRLDGRGVTQYFKAIIANLDDTYPGEGDATFSGSLTINGDVSETDPLATP
jgi:hypothetical protein